MSKANELAYPFKYTVGSDYGVGNYEVEATGLTKREYFAAMFTAAYIQSPKNSQPNWVKDNAVLGLAQADALIEELNKQSK